jgi:hypothetical protein
MVLNKQGPDVACGNADGLRHWGVTAPQAEMKIPVRIQFQFHNHLKCWASSDLKQKSMRAAERGDEPVRQCSEDAATGIPCEYGGYGATYAMISLCI